MPILLTGASGFLGLHLARLLQEQERPFTGVYSRTEPPFPAIQLDLSDKGATLNQVSEMAPGAIIHLAAASNPNWCELYPADSQAINAQSPVWLAAYCRDAGIPFLFTSTDLVFDGQQAPYGEDWAPSPICTYGRHKAEAEQGVLLAHPGAVIARLPLLYGWSGFLRHWVEQMRQGMPITAFADEYRTPAYGGDVAAGILLLLDKGASGIFHLGGREALSRFEMGRAIARGFGLDERLVLPGRQADIPMPAPRPADVSLSSEKAYGLGYAPRPLAAVLEEMGAAH